MDMRGAKNLKRVLGAGIFRRNVSFWVTGLELDELNHHRDPGKDQLKVAPLTRSSVAPLGRSVTHSETRFAKDWAIRTVSLMSRKGRQRQRPPSHSDTRRAKDAASLEQWHQ